MKVTHPVNPPTEDAEAKYDANAKYDTDKFN